MRYLVGFLGVLAASLTVLCGVAFSIQGCGGNKDRCVDGDLRCGSGDFAIQECGGGQWVERRSCSATGQTCVETDAGGFVCSAACTAGETQCSQTRNEVQLCNTGGLWEASEICQVEGACQTIEGTTRCLTCVIGATRCADGDTKVETCTALWEWDVSATCDSNQACQVSNGAAQCAAPGAPMITEVEWVWADPCTYMTPSDVTITTTATGAGLRYSGSVSDCTGNFDDSEVVLTCQNETLMSGSVTVTDLESRRDEVGFAFDACIDGRVCADGEPCCTEGTTRCNESADQVEQCEADGSWEVAETCGSGQRCYLNGPVAECRAEDCTEPDFQCVESDGWPGTDVEYCWNGTWVLSQSCQEGKPAGWVCVINDAHDPPLYYCGAP